MLNTAKALSDLYKIGKNVTFDGVEDPLTGEDLKVWVTKPNQLQHSEILNKANASKAVVMTIKNLPEDDEHYLNLMQKVFDLGGREAYVEYLVEADSFEKEREVAAEIAAKDKWKKEQYLEGLIEAWTTGLELEYYREEKTEESLRVFNEIKKFQDEVTGKMENIKTGISNRFQRLTDQQLEKKIFEKELERMASEAWLADYRWLQILYSVREDSNHSIRVFDDLDQIRDLDLKVLTKLTQVIDELNVDMLSGKS